jgi:hypothetical protein
MSDKTEDFIVGDGSVNRILGEAFQDEPRQNTIEKFDEKKEKKKGLAAKEGRGGLPAVALGYCNTKQHTISRPLGASYHLPLPLAT